MLMGYIPRVTKRGQWQNDIALSIPLAKIAMTIGCRYNFVFHEKPWGHFGTNIYKRKGKG